MRFIVCVDVEEETLGEGYAHLYESMKSIKEYWSCTSAFDDDGNLVGADDLTAAAVAFRIAKETGKSVVDLERTARASNTALLLVANPHAENSIRIYQEIVNDLG